MNFSEIPRVGKNLGKRCPKSLQNGLLALFVFHFLGVLAEPLRFFSRSEVRTGPEFALLSETLKPYSQWLYMNHGYFFFAPNPGPGHLIECTLSNTGTVGTGTLASGVSDSRQTLLFPDRREHWPRLLYHRYFMLAEFYTSRFAPSQVDAEAKKDPEFMQRWAFDKDLYDRLGASISDSLKHSRKVDQVLLKRLERLLPDSQQVLKEGWTLNDPRLLNVLSESLLDAARAEPVEEQVGELPSKKPEGRNP